MYSTKQTTAKHNLPRPSGSAGSQ